MQKVAETELNFWRSIQEGQEAAQLESEKLSRSPKGKKNQNGSKRRKVDVDEHATVAAAEQAAPAEQTVPVEQKDPAEQKDPDPSEQDPGAFANGAAAESASTDCAPSLSDGCSLSGGNGRAATEDAETPAAEAPAAEAPAAGTPAAGTPAAEKPAAGGAEAGGAAAETPAAEAEVSAVPPGPDGDAESSMAMDIAETRPETSAENDAHEKPPSSPRSRVSEVYYATDVLTSGMNQTMSDWNLDKFVQLPHNVLKYCLQVTRRRRPHATRCHTPDTVSYLSPRLTAPRVLPQHIPGVTSPMMYFGMLYSMFCWHAEDNDLNSISYLHDGCPKTWYGVPADNADTFESSFREKVTAHMLQLQH